MNNPLNPEEFRRQGHLLVDFIADYYTNIQQFPVLSQVQPGYLRQLLPQSAPETSEPIEKIIADIQTHIIPGITHWQHPSHFAYFPCTASTAGVLGELLTAGFNVVGFSWVSSPAATELEIIVMDWLGKMVNLPESFLFSGDGGGVIMGTTCEALLATLVAARDQKLSQVGKDKLSKLVVYCSDQTHCAFQKAARIVGIQSGNIRVITTTKTTSFGMSSDSLESAIRLDLRNGLVPLFLCATVGTTATAAVDPLEAICHVANKHSLWVHVDAAYAGSACICPEFRHFIDGVEGVDSFSLNAHKWLLTTLDCCCLWLKDPNALKKSLSTNPEYLKNNASESGGVVDYKDWQVTLSRRFRSLKLWLVLRSYGVDGLRSFIRSHVSMAETFMQLVSEDERFELVVPCHFSLVCFRILLPAERRREELVVTSRTNEMNKKLLEAVNGSGRVFMTHVVAGGIYMIRFAVGATLTERRHVAAAWDVVVEHADAMEKGVLE
ncbi:Tyrosine decarboxylase [Linum grandiflorum]